MSLKIFKELAPESNLMTWNFTERGEVGGGGQRKLPRFPMFLLKVHYFFKKFFVKKKPGIIVY